MIDKESPHYDAGGLETIEILRAKLTHQQFEGYCLGNILKYASRADWKGTFQRDIEKIVVYGNILLERYNSDER